MITLDEQGLEPGLMTLVEGDEEVKRFLSGADSLVNDWLYEVVDSLVFHGEQRLREHAPGSIKGLVDVAPAHETASGAFEGIAGVEPDITKATFGSGLGSDPADYPVYVEVGTGVFGDVGLPISSIPGHLMGPITDPVTGRDFFLSEMKGQPAQRYAERSFEELVGWVPTQIKLKLPELGRRV